MAYSITGECISCAARKAENSRALNCRLPVSWATCTKGYSALPFVQLESLRPSDFVSRESISLNAFLLSEVDCGFGDGLRRSLESLIERTG